MLVGLEYWHIQKYKSSYLEEKDQSFDTLLHKYRRSIFGAFVEEFQLIQMNKGEGKQEVKIEEEGEEEDPYLIYIIVSFCCF